MESEEDLLSRYDERKGEIRDRLEEFRDRELSDRDMFKELVFCLLVPQSRAKRCWEGVEELDESGTLWNGSEEEIREVIRPYTRFHKTKAGRVVEARQFFMNGSGELEMGNRMDEFSDPEILREWLVDNVRGMGHKLASQFLRNAGIHQDFAILDNHVRKNLEELGVAENPKTLTRKRYLEIEEEMRGFSEDVGIPMAELDLLLWSRETGEVFK